MKLSIHVRNLSHNGIIPGLAEITGEGLIRYPSPGTAIIKAIVIKIMINNDTPAKTIRILLLNKPTKYTPKCSFIYNISEYIKHLS